MAVGGLRLRLRLSRAFAAVLVLLCTVPALLLVGAGRAAAHAALASTSPAQDAVTASAPKEVVLSFSEDVSVPSEAVRVLGPDGLRVDDRRPGHAGGDGRTARVALPGPLAEGTYVVSWRVVSADSHPVSGGFTFSFGRASSGAPEVPVEDAGGGAVGVLYDLGRYLAYTGFCLLVGGAAFAGWCRRAAVPGPLRRLVLAGWLMLLSATAALLVLRAPYESGGGLGAVFDLASVRETAGGRPAVALLLRLVLVVLLGVALRRAAARRVGTRTSRRGWSGSLLPGAAACGTAATWAAAEHASAGLQVPLAVPLDLLHLLAMAVWLGGLAALLVTLYRVADPLPELASAAARFSRLAQGAVVVLALTGAYQSWRQVGSWHALGGTGYGRLLLAKLGGVAVLLAAAGYSRRWTARLRAASAPVDGPAVPVAGAQREEGPERRRLRRSVAAEVGVGAVVLALTALLTTTEPGRTQEEFGTVAAAAPAPTVYLELPFDTGAAGGRGRGSVSVVMDPGRVGDNSVQAVVLTRGRAIAVVPELRIRMALPERGVGPLEVRLQRRGAAWQADDLRVPMAGRWTVTAVVRTSDIDEDTVTAEVDIPPYR
ncbi:copper resistance CopC/CopD family protein [Peterkaempfera bronchialis]|uniref:copper resistance CopC/CopD family protein n=1 Tax=Peterkaempfera bronchialis TaxID=2126346 RepID=UPI003C2F12BA